MATENGQSSSSAPGFPGVAATWSPAAKCGIGRALSPLSRLAFTLGRGILNEVYYPALDQAAIRDLEFIVTGPGGFFSEEQKDCATNTELLAAGVPGYRIENLCGSGRYRILKEIITDPHRDVLVQRVKISPLKDACQTCVFFACSLHALKTRARTIAAGSILIAASKCSSRKAVKRPWHWRIPLDGWLARWVMSDLRTPGRTFASKDE